MVRRLLFKDGHSERHEVGDDPEYYDILDEPSPAFIDLQSPLAPEDQLCARIIRFKAVEMQYGRWGSRWVEYWEQ